MPELPDVCVYVEALERTIVGRVLQRVRIATPFVLRSYDPPIDAVFGRTVHGVRRIGKRIVLFLDHGDELFIVLHLMIAGRLHWKKAGQKSMAKMLAAFDFAHGTLFFTEAGTRKRASITVVRGEAALRA